MMYPKQSATRRLQIPKPRRFHLLLKISSALLGKIVDQYHVVSPHPGSQRQDLLEFEEFYLPRGSDVLVPIPRHLEAQDAVEKKHFNMLTTPRLTYLYRNWGSKSLLEFGVGTAWFETCETHTVWAQYVALRALSALLLKIEEHVRNKLNKRCQGKSIEGG